jgi:hypothetical protein
MDAARAKADIGKIRERLIVILLGDNGRSLQCRVLKILKKIAVGIVQAHR